MENWHYFNKNSEKIIIVIAGVLLSCVLVTFTGCGNLTEKLNEAVERGIYKDILSDLPLQTASLKVEWTEKSANDASGKFSARIKATEGLYESVSNENALRKLGITNLYESEFEVAKRQISSMSEQRRTNLRNVIPNDPPRIRFYDVLVPKGGEVTLAGSVELTKYGDNDWKVKRFLVDPFSYGDKSFYGDKCTPESMLEDNTYKLDDPNTKGNVNTMVQARKDFAARVNVESQQEQEEIAERQREQVKAAAEAVERQRKQEKADVEAAALQEQQRRAEILDGAAVLKDEIRNSGLNSLSDFVRYGSAALKDRLVGAEEALNNAGRLDDRAIPAARMRANTARTDIRNTREEIAQKIFLDEYAYRVGNVENFGNGVGGFTMTIRTEYNDRNPKVVPSFPVPNIEVVGGGSAWGTIELSVRGSNISLKELTDNSNNYLARIRCEKLRYNDRSDSIEADVLDITIIEEADRLR